MKARTNIKKTFILIVLVAFLMAFTDKNQGKAKLIFLYERAFWGKKIVVKVNGQKVINLPNNRYFEIEVDANDVEIFVDRDKSMSKKGKPDIQTTLRAEPDKVYYLKIYHEVDYFTDKLYLVRISEQTAKQAIKSMKLEKISLGNE